MVLNFLKSASLRALVLLVPFLMPSLASATTCQLMLESSGGYYWYSGMQYMEPGCNAVGGTFTTSGNTWYCATSVRVYAYKSPLDQTMFYGTDPDKWVTRDLCQAYVPAPEECPSGQVDIGTAEAQECVSICNAGTTDTLLVSLSAIPQQVVTSLGCPANYNGTIGNCSLTDNLDSKCYAEYNQTGEFEEDNDCTVTPASQWDACYSIVGEGGTEPYDSTDNTTGNTSTITDATASTQVDPPVVDTLPDGTVITTDIQVDSSSASDKVVISETNPDFIFVEENDGSTTITQTQKTTTSNPDGSSTVSTEQTTTFTSPKTTNTTLDKSTGSSSSTSTGGTSTTSGSTVINNYNASGDLTSSTQEQDGDGSGTDEPCPVNTICDEEGTEYALPEGEGSFDEATTELDQKIATAKADLLTTFNSIKGEASQLVSFNAGSGSGALPCPPPIQIQPFGTFDLCFQGYEAELSIVGTIIIFIAYFLALAIILR